MHAMPEWAQPQLETDNGKKPFDKTVRHAKREVEDLIDEAGDIYDTVRDDVRRKAERTWAKRGDYMDEVVSYGECAADMVAKRFRADPVGTLAVGAILLWVAGRLVRR